MTDHNHLDGILDGILEAFDPKHLFPDLVGIVAWMLATVICIYTPPVSETPLLILFGLPMVLFIPGYVLIAALFPGKDDLDGIERIALSFGLSIAVVPLIGLGLNYTPWGIRLDPIVTSLIIFTATMLLIAQYRRFLLPPEERFAVPLRRIIAGVREELFAPGRSRLDRILSILLVVAIAAAILTGIHVIMAPKEGEHFTKFYILGEGGKAASYPTTFSAGDPQTVIIGIGNHEYRTVTYTVEAWLYQQTFDPATNASSIDASWPLDAFTMTLAHNETKEFPYTFTVNTTQFNRLEFLLFNETIPSGTVTRQDRINASYQDLHLWIKVRNPP